jgi:hypothetical protein
VAQRRVDRIAVDAGVRRGGRRSLTEICVHVVRGQGFHCPWPIERGRRANDSHSLTHPLLHSPDLACTTLQLNPPPPALAHSISHFITKTSGVDEQAMAQALRDVQAGMPIEHAAPTHNLTPATLEKRHASHESGTATPHKRPKTARPEAASEDDAWSSEIDEAEIAKFAAEFCVGDLKPNHPNDIYRHLGWKDEASFAPRPLAPELEAAMAALAPPRSIGIASNVTLTRDMLCQAKRCDFAHEDPLMLTKHYNACHPDIMRHASARKPGGMCTTCFEDERDGGQKAHCSSCREQSMPCTYLGSIPLAPQPSTQGPAVQEPARPHSFRDYDPTTRSWDRLSGEKH